MSYKLIYQLLTYITKNQLNILKKNYVIDVILIKFITNFWEGAQFQ